MLSVCTAADKDSRLVSSGRAREYGEAQVRGTGLSRCGDLGGAWLLWLKAAARLEMSMPATPWRLVCPAAVAPWAVGHAQHQCITHRALQNSAPPTSDQSFSLLPPLPFHKQISSPAIYAVFAKLPTVGPVVEQPDGGLAYAAPQQQQHPPPRTYQQV